MSWSLLATLALNLRRWERRLRDELLTKGHEGFLGCRLDIVNVAAQEVDELLQSFTGLSKVKGQRRIKLFEKPNMQKALLIEPSSNKIFSFSFSFIGPEQ